MKIVSDKLKTLCKYIQCHVIYIVPTSPPIVNSPYVVDPTSLHLSWSAPPVDQQNGIIRHYNITFTELETGFTFSYIASSTNFTITSLHPDYQYQIEISAVTIGAGPMSIPTIFQMPEDGRIYLTRATLFIFIFFSMSAPSAPPDEISIDAVYPESVYLSWRPPLPEFHNGEITGYNLTFTATNPEEILSIFSASNSTEMRSLKPFTTYTTTVAAVTHAGIGPYSTAVTFMTDEAGRSSYRIKLEEFSHNTLYFAAPNSPPELLNVTAVSSTSILLTWSPPPLATHNGIIRDYRVDITEVDSGMVLVLYSITTFLTVTSLHPFYTYLCRVSAFTVEDGPYSENVEVFTLEDGE